MSREARPVGGPIATRPFVTLAAIFAVAAALILWRFAAGLGATTALSDGYPWGLWIAFDVVTGTALACGGYAMAILVYVLNRGRYHPMVRSAILTSALGYTIAGLSVVLDIGRPWLAWKIPMFFWSWNLHSALLEVALCIMAYMAVLWIELSPALLERLGEGKGAIAGIARKAGAIVEKALVGIIALGMLLPTMHQSSLGSLMLLTGPKLHPLWQTPLLPLLFLVSCIAMGFAAVVFESALASFFFRREPETKMLGGLAGATAPILGAFILLRVADVAWRGQLPRVFALDRYAAAFWTEGALLVAGLAMLLQRSSRRDLGHLFRAALVIMLGGGLYRFNTYLVAYRPGDDVSYFPSVPEFTITLGLVALEVLAYVTIVKVFPILSGAPRAAAER